MCGSTALTMNTSVNLNKPIISQSKLFYKTQFLKYTSINNSKFTDIQNLTFDALKHNLSIYLTTGDDKVLSLTVDNILYGEKRLVFNNAYVIPYYVKDGYYYADDEKLSMYSCGETFDEMQDEIFENFIVAWELYVECDERELSYDAVELRNELIRMIKVI